MSFLSQFQSNALSRILAQKYFENTVDVYSDVVQAYSRRVNRENVSEEVLHRVFSSENFKAEISDILVEGSSKNNTIISQVFRAGGNAGYTMLKADSIFGESFIQGFNFLTEYNDFLLRETVSDLGGAVMERVAAGFLAEEHPFMIARDILSSGVDLPVKGGFSSRQRAYMIARTEISRAYNQGLAQAYSNMGVSMYDHICGENPCSDCLEREANNSHSLLELDIPVHPNCVCGCAPVVPEKIEYNDNGEIMNLTPVEFDFGSG